MQPFERHRANLAELVASGGQLRQRAAEAGDVTALTQRAYQPAIGGWLGIGATELQAAPQTLVPEAERAGRALAWAGLVADYWAGEVDAFNRAVDAIATGGGQPPHWGATGAEGEPPSEDAILAAKHAAQQRWHQAHNVHILNGGDRAAAMLDDGPTDAHLATLARAGLLPQQWADPVPGSGADWLPFAIAGAGLGGPGTLLAQYDPEGLRARLDLLRSLGTDPSEYADLLQLYWVSVAAEKAGIDLAEWDPSRGANALSDIIPAVYRYYGDLYLENPQLQWAGMANLIGPTFAAGFYDLNDIRTLFNRLGRLAPIPVLDVPGLDNLPASELRFFETTFLQMHQDIFFDQAMMHEAYREGGLDAIAELEQAGLIDYDTGRAWQQIDQGQQTLDNWPSSPPIGIGGAFEAYLEYARAQQQIEQGNEQLLLREQRDIIQDHYTEMYDRPVTGPAFTYLLGAIGESAIPGSSTFAEHQPLEVPVRAEVETPSVRIPFTDIGVGSVDIASVEVGSVETPFPDGNLAHFDDRWGFIEADTLPSYQELIREDPEQAREIIASDPNQRIEDFRIHNRVDDIAGDLLTGWGYDLYLEGSLGPFGGRVGG